MVRGDPRHMEVDDHFCRARTARATVTSNGNYHVVRVSQ